MIGAILSARGVPAGNYSSSSDAAWPRAGARDLGPSKDDD
jgi:hypothetical protein